MQLKLYRISSQADSTSGILYINNEFVCYTLEDEQRQVKVKHETAIPLGIYEIKFRTVGGFHTKYTSRFGDMHKGMLELQDVPDFQYILIHCGNTDEHTSGCILLGDSQNNNIVQKDGFIGSSTQSYKRVYPKIASALLNNEKVTIEIVDLTEVDAKEISNKTTDDFISGKQVFEKLEAINGNLINLNAKMDGKQVL